MKQRMRVISWFSCGAASAVTAKLIQEKLAKEQPRGGYDFVIARCVVENEHPDNDRFASDCEKWFGQPIRNLRSDEFKDCWEVWEKRRYLSGVRGAPCTGAMKKEVRWSFERLWWPTHQAFGFTSEEKDRAERFTQQNPDVRLLTPLIDDSVSKQDCMTVLSAADIAPSAMYALGFANANCIGCVKSTSPRYWARVRHNFPEVFKRMSELSRRLGVRMVQLHGARIFLDELPDSIDISRRDRGAPDCGVLCGTDR